MQKTTDGLTAAQSSKQGNKIISSIITTGTAFELLIQQGIKRVLRHGEAFHDVDMAKRFIQAVATVPGYAVNQLVVYVEKRSPIKFEYDVSKKSIVGVSEQKDANGNLVRAYAPDEILDQAPFGKEQELKKQNSKAIEPWSFAMYKKRLASLEQQLVQAGEPEGRGLLGPNGTTIRKGDTGWDQTYNSLFNLVHNHRNTVDSLIPLITAGTPSAAAVTVITQKVEKPEGSAKKLAA